MFTIAALIGGGSECNGTGPRAKPVGNAAARVAIAVRAFARRTASSGSSAITDGPVTQVSVP
jgi:hypothetical protein